MADYNLKVISADTDGPSADTEFLFGSPDQSSGTPKPYSFAGIKIWIKSWLSHQTMQPGYVSGRYYIPFHGASNAGASPSANSLRLIPFVVQQSVTISDLATRVNTLSAGGNVQFAVYASNASTLRPTGNALASTASISTAATGAVTGALSGNITLTPGLQYWLASNCDNGTAVFASLGASGTYGAVMIGSSTLVNVFPAGGQCLGGLFVAQTFGTWPDLTSGSFTDGTNPPTIPIAAFKVV